MNIKEIDKWLDNEYGVSYTRLEELHDFVVEQDLKHREEKDKEIDRLNNIINGFDKWLENINIGELDDFFIGVKLSELKKAWNDIKGVDKECM